MSAFHLFGPFKGALRIRKFSGDVKSSSAKVASDPTETFYSK
jgi:hypothetical protein